MALGLLGLAAPHIIVGNDHPLLVPAIVIARDHPACGQEALRHRSSAFLRLAQGATVLVGWPWEFRPMMPAIRLIVRMAVHNFGVDEFLLAHGHGHASL